MLGNCTNNIYFQLCEHVFLSFTNSTVQVRGNFTGGGGKSDEVQSRSGLWMDVVNH